MYNILSCYDVFGLRVVRSRSYLHQIGSIHKAWIQYGDTPVIEKSKIQNI